MTRITRTLLIALGAGLLAGGTPADAATYRWVDDNGVVTYSDRPPQPREAPPAPAAASAADATAPGAVAADRATIDELLDVSGLKRQLAPITTRIRSEFHAQHGQLAARDLARAEQITARHVRTETVYGLIAEGVGKRSDAAKLAAALAWYRSPVGRRITELEVAFSRSSGTEREIERYVGRLQQSPPARERLALVQRLDAAGRATETSLDVSIAIIRSLASAVDPYLPAERRLSRSQLESRIRQVRAQVFEQVRRLSFVMMLFIYRDVSDADLARYVAFAESEPGQWYVSAVSGAFVDAVGGIARGAATDLVRAVPPERWQQGGGFKKPALPKETAL
ncbi:MAG: hypothetical protein A3E31_10405 [Candidatus Rokubacteria bacterium RIFCSPHIGHO2_12_FULL_73_22]|nr:MAG: hypothetical protein A3E31_10405 [Candidatus Rokubacteria bacterium RIFCSPHIGHO2_12_FULL_73_22]